LGTVSAGILAAALGLSRLARERILSRYSSITATVGSVSERKIFYVFPGQGSQYKGMGSDLVREFDAARDVYARASDVVGYDMAKLSFEDPRNEINTTRFTQPALLTHEIACYSVFQHLTREAVRPFLTAGHSLGEYAALVVAGALELEDALALVAERGRLMATHGRGSMLATTLDLETATELADKHYCGIGGANLPDQTVIAGESEDLDALAEDLAKTQPGKRGVRLNTEGAFHTYLMITAALEFRKTLRVTDFHNLDVAVLSNYSGKPHVNDPDAIRSRLFFQLFNPVRWTSCMTSAIEAGADTILEFGGGIGKGETPAEKRPNLEGIVKKSLKWREREA
jgi:[acyl-carrier-protein] S-malonyltransferase